MARAAGEPWSNEISAVLSVEVATTQAGLLHGESAQSSAGPASVRLSFQSLSPRCMHTVSGVHAAPVDIDFWSLTSCRYDDVNQTWVFLRAVMCEKDDSETEHHLK